MNENPKTRRVSSKKLRRILHSLADDICDAVKLKNRITACKSGISAYLCNALHLSQATESPTAIAAGLFYGRGLCRDISSVPCGALMRPLPGSRCNATGSGTFSVFLRVISVNIHFI